MLPGTYNYSIYQGDGRTFILNLKSGAGAFNATGYTLSGGIAKQRGGTIVATYEVEFVGNPTAGVVKVKLTGTESANLKAGIWYYDVQMKPSDDVPTTLITGTITSVGQVN